MIDAYKNSKPLFDNMVGDMQESLKQFASEEQVVKTASNKDDSTLSALAMTVSGVASKLAELGHPMAKKADEVLLFIAKNSNHG